MDKRDWLLFLSLLLLLCVCVCVCARARARVSVCARAEGMLSESLFIVLVSVLSLSVLV